MPILYDLTNYGGNWVLGAHDWIGGFLGEVTWKEGDDPADFDSVANEAETAMDAATDSLLAAAREVRRQYTCMKLNRMAAANLRGQVVVPPVTIIGEEKEGP